MQKPADYDKVQAANFDEYEVLEPGGYICVIKGAKVQKSKKDKDMLALAFDIAEGDKKDFYLRRFQGDTREDRKWPGLYYQLIEGDNTRFFKGLVTAIEESNTGFKFDFDEEKLAGKLFGGVFGREEYFNQFKGQFQFSTKLLYVRNANKIRNGDFKVPEDKIAKRAEEVPHGAPPGFYATETLTNDDELPF